MKKTLRTAIFVALALSVQAVGANLIVNGDFEAGNTGFTTEYKYLDPSVTGTWTLGPEYMYTVSTNPSLYHSQWANFGDHTTGTGKMMIVNGTWDDYTPNYNAIVWEQTVTPLPCVSVYPETTVTLFAGQTWDIGDVLVKTSATGICVKFVMNDDTGAISQGWRIIEAQVDVAATLAGIPQKNGNPQPGQFDKNVNFAEPGVTDTDWICVDYAWTVGTPLVIAAHVRLEKPGVLAPEFMTGWGDGPNFSGKNWATYIEYTPDVDCDYGDYVLMFWAGNSFPGNPTWPAQPAILEVSINDVVVGTLALEYNLPYAPTPGWMKFSTTWDAGSATSANIKIRDTRHIMYGDDFVLDDISFVRQ